MSRKKPEKKEISQGWLTTYSDMMTLVLTFFVLLYSFALVDLKKFNSMAASIRSAFGGENPSILQYNYDSGNAPILGSSSSGGQSENDVYQTVSKFIETNSLKQYVTIKEGSRGVYIEFNEKILFDSGRAEIKQQGMAALMKISELIRNMPNQIVIEGHTDNVPIHTDQYSSNWELSTARSLSVLKYFIENRGMDPRRFSIAGYGEYDPIASNDAPEGRAQNRRVNILIITAKETPAVERK